METSVLHVGWTVVIRGLHATGRWRRRLFHVAWKHRHIRRCIWHHSIFRLVKLTSLQQWIHSFYLFITKSNLGLYNELLMCLFMEVFSESNAFLAGHLVMTGDLENMSLVMTWSLFCVPVFATWQPITTRVCTQWRAMTRAIRNASEPSLNVLLRHPRILPAFLTHSGNRCLFDGILERPSRK